MRYTNVQISGDVFGEVESRVIKTNKGDMQVIQFTVAIGRKEKDQWTNDYFTVKAFGKTAEYATTPMKDGTLKLAQRNNVFVSGEIQQEKWQDQSGNKRSKVVIIANKIELVEAYKASADDDLPA